MDREKIVFFTIGYPYGRGDEFLEAEMKCAESYFDKILIVSCNKRSNTVLQYLPANAEVLNIRDTVSNAGLLFLRLSCMLSYKVWKQVIIGLKERGLSKFLECLKASVSDQSTIRLLEKNESNWAGQYEYYYSYWLSGTAAYLAVRKSILAGSTFSRAHGYDCFFYRGFHPFRKEQLEYLDYIFPISEAGKEDLIKQGCNRNKVIVSRLGVEKKDRVMNPYVPLETKTIVTCSNIVDLKRLDLLIDALSITDDIHIHWIHFGDGVLNDEIREMAGQKLSKKSNVKYSFKGRVAISEILNFYGSTSVDCFINCSDVEGIPVSIMEAMSYGIPCVARDVGGVHEIVTNDNGLLLPEKCTADQLKNAIVEILTMTQNDYIAKRGNAYQTYSRQYDAEVNYPAFFQQITEDGYMTK